jgi:hypothetical protein
VIREMLSFTQTIFHSNVSSITSGESWEPRPLSGLQLGVHCRWSPAVLDELRTGELQLASTLDLTSVYADGVPDRLHAGDRAPRRQAWRT